jgi:hypothetical protein
MVAADLVEGVFVELDFRFFVTRLAIVFLFVGGHLSKAGRDHTSPV